MKHLFLFIGTVFFSAVAMAQDAGHAFFDMKNGNGSVEQVIPVKGQGALFVVFYSKSSEHDLVFYDNSVNKKWDYHFTAKELGLDYSYSNADYDEQIYYLNGEFLFISARAVGSKKEYSIYSIGLDGELNKKSVHEEENKDIFRGIITNGKQVFMNFGNGETGPKQSYYLLQFDPSTLSFGEKINLHLPVLKEGQWQYAGKAGGNLYFYGVPKATTKDNMANGFNVDFVPVNDDGQLEPGFTINIKLKNFYPGPEYFSGEMGGMSPALYFYIDTASKSIYTFCNMTESLSALKEGRCKGIYLQKYDLDGKQVWSQQYDNSTLEKFDSKTTVKDIESSMFSSNLSIDDSTHDIVLVRKTVTLYGAADAKCYLFDKDGNLKKAFTGIDQSGKKFGLGYIKLPESPFYSSLNYNAGDPLYYKTIQSAFSKYISDKHKPMGLMLNIGGKFLLAIIDGEKYTLDIYEL